MRGSHSLHVVSDADAGIIPAHAGLTRVVTHQVPIPGIIPAHAGLTLKNPNIDAILSGPHPVFYSFLRVIR